MKNIIVTACLFGVLALSAWASILSEDETEFMDSSETASHDLAKEAIALGQMLREVAADMAQDKTFNVEEEEYFFGSFLEKLTTSIKKAGEKVGAALNNVTKELEQPVKDAAKAAMEAGLQKVKEELKKKGVTLVAKIFQQSIASYAIEDNVNEADFLEQLRVRIDEVGQRLINQGQTLKDLEKKRLFTPI